MKIGFVAIPEAGHLNPMTALARELQRRTHQIAFISTPDTEAFVSKVANLAFVPSCQSTYPLGAMKEVSRRISEEHGQRALEATIEAIARMTDALLDELPTIVDREDIDALVLDTSHWYMELVPMKLGIPFVHLSNAMHFDYSGHTPLCVYDWAHGSTPEVLIRNRKGVADYVDLLRRANPRAIAYAEHAGIDMDVKGYNTLSTLAWI